VSDLDRRPTKVSKVTAYCPVCRGSWEPYEVIAAYYDGQRLRWAHPDCADRADRSDIVPPVPPVIITPDGAIQMTANAILTALFHRDIDTVGRIFDDFPDPYSLVVRLAECLLTEMRHCAFDDAEVEWRLQQFGITFAASVAENERPKKRDR
jgi:hypothetical protein